MSEEIADSARVIITRNDLQVRIKKPLDLNLDTALTDQLFIHKYTLYRYDLRVQLKSGSLSHWCDVCLVHGHNSVAILKLIGRKGCELTSRPKRKLCDSDA